MKELLALTGGQVSLLFLPSSFACPPPVFELVCLINSDIYKGLRQPQEIKPSLSLHLCAASEKLLRRRRRRRLFGLLLTPVRIRLDINITPFFKEEGKQLGAISMRQAFPSLMFFADISQPI